MLTEYDKTIQHLWWKATIGYDDMREAAEFEQRVAIKLANVFQHINDYWINLPCDACPQEGKCDMDCNDSILKWARLQVEEEMDADS